MTTCIWRVTRDQKVPGSTPVWVASCGHIPVVLSYQRLSGVDIYQWCLTIKGLVVWTYTSDA